METKVMRMLAGVYKGKDIVLILMFMVVIVCCAIATKRFDSQDSRVATRLHVAI